MPAQVYVNFNGNCREAVAFYAQAFGCGAPKILTYGDMPPDKDFPPLSDEVKKRVMHTERQITGGTIMCSDITPFMKLTGGNNINSTLVRKNAADIQKWSAGLREGASVHMEPQKTFWSSCYAIPTDKFGIPWQLSQNG